MQRFQDRRKIQNGLFIVAGFKCLFQQLQVRHSGQAKQAVILSAAAVPLEVPVTAFQHELIRLCDSFGFIAVAVYICKGNQPVFLQRGFHGLQRPFYVPVPHPRLQINAYLIRLQLNISCFIRGNDAFDLCKHVHEIFSPQHSGKVGQPHQQRRKLIRGKNLFIHLVLRHYLKPAAHAGP